MDAIACDVGSRSAKLRCAAAALRYIVMCCAVL